MHFSLLFMSASLATAVIAAPVAEESTQFKRAPAPSKNIVITLALDADVDLTKREASNDVAKISIDADGTVHVGKRAAAPHQNDGIDVDVDLGGNLDVDLL